MNINPASPIQGNILIIDDTPENLQLLAQTLSEKGYTIRGAIKGKMGIKAALSAPPDLILLDIKMPDLDGYEVCKILKAEPKTQGIPVIFLSALDDVWDKVKAFQIGGVDYITKPFQIEEVLVRVENQLLIRQLTKQLVTQSQQLQIQNEQLQQEIIERRKAEKAAEAASKAKSEFVANMSHELRTPLNVILSFTQILNRDSLLNNEQRNYLGIINRSGEHLLGLIDDVLELSKIEAGKILLNEGIFDFYYFLDSLEEMFQVKAEQKGLYLIFKVSSDVPQYIKTDQQKLRCCLINLIGNALKFTQSGSVTLQVSVLPNSENCPLDTKMLLFEVEDTGPGIPNQEIEKIFQAFAQTETGIKTTEGAGLGLAISEKFVQLMGGKISVNSKLGAGSNFYFNIKVSQPKESGIIIKPRRQVIGLELGQKPYRILVVDDIKENRLLLIKLLEPIGFEVYEAENGQEAVAQWLEFQPHLIWIDTRMPVMDGLAATQEIRMREKNNFDAGQFKTVIIALTASVFEENKGRILAAGCDDFVRKPFGEEVIFAKIAQYLGVRYIYEYLPQSATVPRKLKSIYKKSDSFFLEKMATMPSNWLLRLKQAAKNFDEDLVYELTDQIPDNNSELRQALRDLLDDFRLDLIFQFTQVLLNSN